uniref:uncharacterized protein LOC122598806 n=1 Tax=Erigeron canadensis TaxID=72917 RepID=UPI001CB941D6|nr:uncharacterized protein LOC122598806 [Erigeron canadensis]
MASTTFAHLKIPLEEVVKATNNFDEKYVIGEGDFGKVYRGQLLLSSGKLVNIAARRLDLKQGQGDVEFWTEISVLSSLKHENIVSLIGFCDEKGEKIIILNKHEASKGSLSEYLTDPSLTWIQRLKICLGVARALQHIHNVEGLLGDHSVIHRNINSSTVLLDDNWEAKLSGFEFSIKQSVNRMDRVVRISKAIGTTGYMDPSIVKMGGVTHKSDIYSFGVVLCEILCWRKAFIPNAVDNRFLAPLFRSHYEMSTLNDIIHPDLRYQLAPQSLASFSKAAYSCLKKERLQRPNMNDIVNDLEKTLEHQQPLENFQKNLKKNLNIQLSDFQIRLSDILVATDNFSSDKRMEYTRYSAIYKGDFDKENPCSVEGNDRGELTSVVIKRMDIEHGEYNQRKERFFTELEILTICKHPNIVKLLGVCYEGSEMILVVQHLSKGRLDDYFGNIKGMPFTWEQRLKICLDVAHALNYLHSEMEDQKRIIHHDTRSRYIALDENLGAKLVDFGMSLFLPPNQDDDSLCVDTIADTRCYGDPEYKITGKLKRESDVYSFGVVLFELLCGRSAYDKIYLKESDQGLAYVARRCFLEGTLKEMMDPRLKGESGENNFIVPNKNSLNKFIEIAYQCVAETQAQRPTMKIVVNELERTLLFQEKNKQCLNFEEQQQPSQQYAIPSNARQLAEEIQHLPLLEKYKKLTEWMKSENYIQNFDISQGAVAQGILGLDAQLQRRMTRESNEMEILLNVLARENFESFECPSTKMERTIKGSWGVPLAKSRLRIKKWDHLKIPLRDILLATDNFSKACRIRNTIYYEVYIAELKHFDEENLPIKEGKNKCELPWRLSTVVIKRTTGTFDDEVFFKEIEMLTTCKHPNIVKLVGFCQEDYEMILVIEHLSNGYLADYWKNIKDMPILSWEKRLKICLDVAHGLKHLHYEMENQKMIIHRDIMSENIALDENWGAKIVDFRFSIFLPPNQNDDTLRNLNDDTLRLSNYGGNCYYLDPEYKMTGKLKRESDVYSFGIVLFEILCGRLVDDPIYVEESDKGLAFVARRCFREGPQMDLIDPVIKEESGRNNFNLNKGPNKESLDIFVKIAYQCLAEAQNQRPTMRSVVDELEKALLLQENNKDEPIISLEDIKLATENFHRENLIGRGGFGEVYRGKVPQGDGFNTIVAKRLDKRHGQGEQQFRNELQILFEYSHENIIRLLGYCDEKDAKIIVYEYASRGSLDRYLKDARLTWMKRLNICIDVATALAFLHGGAGKQAIVIHRDIKTANILLNDEWKAKLADFGLSLISPINQETDYVIDHVCGTSGYLDPLYQKSRFLTIESDVYSFGVVLFEILCGRFLPGFTKESFEKGKHDDFVFEPLKKQIVPKALIAFQTIANQCLEEDREKRPAAKVVLEQLTEALEFQEVIKLAGCGIPQQKLD